MSDPRLGERRWGHFVECHIDLRTNAMRYRAHIVLELRTDESGEAEWRRFPAAFASAWLRSYEAATGWAQGWIACAHAVRREYIDNDDRIPGYIATAIEPVDFDDLDESEVADG